MGSSLATGSLIGFFVLHYGMFWVVHGVFVFLLPLFAGIRRAPSLRRPLPVPLGRLRSTAARRPVPVGDALAASHG